MKFNSLDEIEDAITEWHESDTDEPLHVFLGLTWHEYALYVTNKAKFWEQHRKKTK
jgi:hypothetical protein